MTILLEYKVTFTFTHLADAFIQSNLQCIQVIHLLSVCVFPGNWTHDLCAANAMLYHCARIKKKKKKKMSTIILYKNLWKMYIRHYNHKVNIMLKKSNSTKWY